MNVKQMTTQKSAGWLALAVAAIAFLFIASTAVQAATPDWDVSGDWDVAFEYGGSEYVHDLSLTQAANGTLTGAGGYPANAAHTFDWVLTSGSVSDDTIVFTADYTAGDGALDPLTTLNASGTIAGDGSMSGTWSDNYQGAERTGTWSTASGTAEAIEAALAAEDFGVMDQSNVKGYTAGFGLSDATLADINTVVVELYSSTTLLQTNTATGNLDDLAGSQFSSPFDVFGTFDYVADGYWVNERETEYGQTLIPTRVVATVTLDDGTVLTAENTLLSGDPSTIFPDTPPPSDAPTAKSECKDGGWMTYTDPEFKNQGQCVAYVNRENRLMR